MTESEKAEAIIEGACKVFGISRAAFYSPRKRAATEVNARVLVSNAVHQLTTLSYTQIGALIHRDHSTVIHHVDAYHHHHPEIAWPPLWVAREIAKMRRELLVEPPVWLLLHDLGEALGVIECVSDVGRAA